MAAKSAKDAAATADVVEPVPDQVLPNARTLLVYTGEPRVVAPFGELSAGQVAAADPASLRALLASGLFAPYMGDPLDAGEIRHP